MYEMTNQIPFTSCGPDKRIHLHKAVGMMMDCCQFQEYQETGFCNFLRSNGLLVFLFSIQIDILRLPEFRETVKTAVKIYGCKSVCGLRQITMKDEQGRNCLISNATGAFFDPKAGKAIKLTPELLSVKFDEPEPMECLPRKIPVPVEDGTHLAPVPVTPSALDPNGHLTSAAYFSIAQDALPEGFSFNRIRIEYKRQAKPGESVIPVRHTFNESVIVVDLKGEDGLSFAVAEFSSVSFAQKNME